MLLTASGRTDPEMAQNSVELFPYESVRVLNSRDKNFTG